MIENAQPKPRNKPCKYEIARALESFVANDFCIVQAARETGIGYSKVCYWVSKYYITRHEGDWIVKQSEI